MTGARGELSGHRADGTMRPRDPHDFYIEPRWAVDALLDVERFDQIWDPAAGSCNIIKACLLRQMRTYASDILERGFGLDEVKSFFDYRRESDTAGYDIICNPPYRQTVKFIRHAIHLQVHHHCWLVQSKFLFSQKRHALFHRHPPRVLYLLSRRPSMPPGDPYLNGEMKAEGGKLDYCWLVWDGWTQTGATRTVWLLPSVGNEPKNRESSQLGLEFPNGPE